MRATAHAMATALAVSERDLTSVRECRRFIAEQFGERHLNAFVLEHVREAATDMRDALDARLSACLPNYRPREAQAA